MTAQSPHVMILHLEDIRNEVWKTLLDLWTWHGYELNTCITESKLFSNTPKLETLHPYHGGRVTLICVGKLTMIGLDDDLSSGRCQAIIWTYAGILLNVPLGTDFCANFRRKKNIFIQENTLVNFCEIVSISSRPQYVTLMFIHGVCSSRLKTISTWFVIWCNVGCQPHTIWIRKWPHQQVFCCSLYSQSPLPHVMWFLCYCQFVL